MSHASERLVSVLCADVVGRVRLHERLGEEEAQWASERCLKRAGRCIEAFGGNIINTAGQELIGVFDSVNSAFRAAIEMQQKVADLPPVSGLKLEIRVGFSYGSAVLSENGPSGDAVNAAAWLAGTAKADQILTSAPSLPALSSMLRQSLQDLGTIAKRGKMAGVGIYTYVPHPVPLSDNATTYAAETTGNHPLLRLTHAGNEFRLDGNQPRFSIGRDDTCHLVIKGHKISRIHATIEFHENRFILIDCSTNGTFIKVGKEPEIRLHRQEFLLRGKGVIGLARSTHGRGTDCFTYEFSDNESAPA